MKLNQLSRLRTKKRITSLSVLFLIITLFLVFNNNQVSAYDLIVYNTVDADSDIDSTANIGTDGATDYTDAQTLDGTDQTLIEANTGGGGGGIVIEETETGGVVGGTTAITGSMTGVEDHLYIISISSKSFETVASVTGMSETWLELDVQCGGRSQTGTTVYYVLGDSSITTGAVTVVLDNAENIAITLTRFSGIDTGDIFGVQNSANTNGVNGACSGGTDGSPATMSMTLEGGNFVWVAIAFRNKVPSIVAGWTLDNSVTYASGGSQVSIYIANKTFSSGGSQTIAPFTHSTVDWAIVAVEINEATGTNFELQWEHQINSVDTNKDVYNLTIFGFSSDSENLLFQTWNIGGSSWNTPLSLEMTTSETWYNQTIDANAIGSSITYRFIGKSETSDTTQTTFKIDYSGVTAWNFTIAYTSGDFGLDPVRPDGTYQAINITTLDVLVSSGDIYNIQLKGTDIMGSGIVNGWLFWDTDSNPIGSTVLTASYTDVYISLSIGDGITSNIWIWILVPFGIADQTIKITIEVQIIKS